MHAITKLARLALVVGAVVLPGCDQPIPEDLTGGDLPPAGIIRGTVSYVGPPPCTQDGHVVGNVILLVFDGHNPPAPAGLGVTAANFGVVSGDVLFHSWPVTEGAAKICPSASAPTQTVSAPYAISPMAAGRYIIQAFFDYTGDFFATFKFRQLPEALDIGGGYVDLNDAQKLVTSSFYQPDSGLPDLEEQQADPNYLPAFLPVDIGTPGPTPVTSLWSVPAFTMPSTGFIADNIDVTVAAKLPLARPYFYPSGVAPQTGDVTLSPIAVNDNSGQRPAAGSTKTPQNPSGNADFIPVLSFPQDMALYAQPDAANLGKQAQIAPTILQQYQDSFPQIHLNAGVPAVEQAAAVDTINAKDPFHMQLGLASPPAGAAPGGNGGLYVWWNGTHTQEDCPTAADCIAQLDFIPESPLVYRLWPLVVLAKLEDLPSGNQPNPNDVQGLLPQGSDLTKPIIIIQGVTLLGDSFAATTTQGNLLTGSAPPLLFPDLVGNTNRQDHVSAMVRPSTLCIDPRAPDNGGVLVAPGTITNGVLTGPYPPADAKDLATAQPGPVVVAANLSNPQLGKLVNHGAAGSTNGLMSGCLPLGRYQVNLVYPTGQAWTTPNETGSCAAAEGTSFFGGSAPDPGTCTVSPRPVLYSQGTRAVIEITDATNPSSCTNNLGLDGKKTADGSPFVCSGLCPDPRLDATAVNAKGIPCAKCLDTTLNPNATPPCSTRL